MKTLASRSEKCTSPQIHRRWCTTPGGSQTLEDTQVTWPYTLRTKSPMGMSQEHGSGCLHKDVNTATVPCVTRRIMEVLSVAVQAGAG